MKIVLLNVEQAQNIYRSQMVRDFPESELKPFASVQGMMTRGTIIRHLVIPGCTGDSLKVMDWIAQNTPQGTPVSIMRQYTPIAQCHVKGLNRRVTDEEYERVLDRARDLGLNAFVQEKESAQSKYIPDFNMK